MALCFRNRLKAHPVFRAELERAAVDFILVLYVEMSRTLAEKNSRYYLDGERGRTEGASGGERK